jgi:hypothetical protein
MKKLFVISPSILIFGWFLASCATPPIDDMNRAQEAVTRAENDADTVAYASHTLLQARDALARMQSEADARRFDAARNHANEAISLAERAIADGRAGASRARGEAENILREIGQLLTETSSAIAAAEQVPNILLDFDSISREMNLARQAYGEAQQSFEAGNYRDVISRGQIIRSILSDINARITEAVLATSRK